MKLGGFVAKLGWCEPMRRVTEGMLCTVRDRTAEPRALHGTRRTVRCVATACGTRVRSLG